MSLEQKRFFDSGRRAELDRIVDLIEREVSEWLSHDGDCDCKVRGEEGSRLIRIIKGGKE